MAANDQIIRVRYFDGQFLRALDFDTEQVYDRDARRRHVLGHHTWGIIAGWELTEVPIQGQSGFVDVVISPGAAIDGFGRELVSYHAIRLDPSAFAAFTAGPTGGQNPIYDIYLSYEEDASGALSSNWADCQSSQATRTTEGWTIVVAPPPPLDDPIIVDGVAAVTEAEAAAAAAGGSGGSGGSGAATAPVIPDDQSVPYQELPESSPGDRWLVKLGSVGYIGSGAQTGFVTAGDQLMSGRTYVGAVASAIYAPGTTLDVRPRMLAESPTPADYDAADFAAVEGRLKVMGRVNAEQDVWLDGGKLHFALPGGSEASAPITLGRETGAGGSGTLLRLRLGTAANDPTMAMSIGPGDAADTSSTPSDIVAITGDDVVSIPSGTLTFDSATRQMVDLYAGSGHDYGVGVQSDTSSGGTQGPVTALYQRSGGAFRWFRGGVHNDNGANDGIGPAGSGGQMQLELDAAGNLNFGSRLGQLLNLWSTDYGIGIQDWTMYFRSDSDFCWFRGGSHEPWQDDPGPGGTLAMRLDNSSTLRVTGGLQIDGDTQLGGALSVGGQTSLGATTVSGALAALGDVSSVVRVRHYEFLKTNNGTSPVTWSRDVSGDFTEIDDAYAVLGGFSIFGQNNVNAIDTSGHDSDINAIPQTVFARVTSITGLVVELEAFCSESLPSNETDNAIIVQLVVTGRFIP